MPYDLSWIDDCASGIDLGRENVAIKGAPSSDVAVGDDPRSSDTVNCVFVDNAKTLNYLISECREKANGRLLFRGQANLYGEIPLAGAYRSGKFKASPIVNRLLGKGEGCVVDEDVLDSYLGNSTMVPQFDNGRRPLPYYALEGVLQQYGGDTRWLDVVDNIIVALWMATRVYEPFGETFRYSGSSFPRRTVRDVVSGGRRRDDKVYLFCIAVRDEEPKVDSSGQRLLGLTEACEFDLLDLRLALPARFLRPHAQHASLLKWRRDNDAVGSSILAIASIPAGVALDLVGGSELLSAASIFPEPEVDYGFAQLCSHVSIKYGDRSSPSRALDIGHRFPMYE